MQASHLVFVSRAEAEVSDGAADAMLGPAQKHSMFTPWPCAGPVLSQRAL